MRTQEKFANKWAELKWWLNFHKTPVWLVATEDDYALSAIEPHPSELPIGTNANMYDVDLNIISTVRSGK